MKPSNRYGDQFHKARPVPLPPPPSGKFQPQTTATAAVDRRGQEAARGSSEQSNRLSTLKAYRRARGLCFKCGEKWGPEHTCPATIQLHVVEELLEFLGPEALGLGEEQVSSDSETLCAISLQALTDRVVEDENVPSVLQIKGWFAGQEVLLLVDSGSTASFMNTRLQHLCSEVAVLKRPVRVKVADARELACTAEVRNCQWETQGHIFTTTFKMLQLGAFDIILGQDWLYAHSPDNP